jgi:hypothetical protein
MVNHSCGRYRMFLFLFVCVHQRFGRTIPPTSLVKGIEYFFLCCCNIDTRNEKFVLLKQIAEQEMFQIHIIIDRPLEACQIKL